VIGGLPVTTGAAEAGAAEAGVAAVPATVPPGTVWAIVVPVTIGKQV